MRQEGQTRRAISRKVLRISWAVLVLALTVIAACTSVRADDGSAQILHATTGQPEIVVASPSAERLEVTVRGETRTSGRARPMGASPLGHAVSAVALPADLRADEPIRVVVVPASAGPAHLVAADAAVLEGVAGARASGVLLGIFLAAVLLQLVAFAFTRESSIPWYVALVASLGLIELAREAALPGVTARPTGTLIVLSLIAGAAYTGFVIVYLRLWGEARSLYWAVLAAFALAVIATFAGIVIPQLHPVLETLRVPFLFAFLFVMIAVVIVRARRYPPAWILLGGVLGLFLSVAYRFVRTHVDSPLLDRWAFEIGTVLDALFFAAAILARIRHAIFDRRVIESRLKEATHDSLHDELTGVLNRRGLFARGRYSGHGTLFAIDLDSFKSINDLYGHPAGDGVLVDVVQTLRSLCAPDDIIARLGGDEFVVIAPTTAFDDAKKIARRITAAIEDISPPGARAPILGFGASVGYVSLENLTFEAALRLADTNAYRTKTQKRRHLG
jgi:diguanylate cyclase (GGDEF)-like protein